MGNTCCHQDKVSTLDPSHSRPKPINNSPHHITTQNQKANSNQQQIPSNHYVPTRVYPPHRPDYNNQNAPQQTPKTNNIPTTVISNKPRVIYVLGGPGSGKGTQCKAILDSFPGKFYHLSTGSILRQATQEPTPEHAAVIQAMKQGKMVPSRYVVQLIKQKISKNGNNFIYILDGFPRNTQNLEAWDFIMRNDIDVKFLLYFQCTQEQMRKRLLGRAMTSGRVDDNPQTIEKRIIIFNDQTKKMLDTFRKNSGNIISVNANQSVDSVTRDVKNVINSNFILL